MKNYIYFLSLLLIITSGTSKGQEKSNTIRSEQKEGNNPGVSVKVNKKYDSKGNLIRYDSAYSYIYTSRGRDSLKTSTDSLFNKFKSDYNKNFSSLFDDKMGDLFFNDSLFKYDFLNEDFFTKRFELNTGKINELFMQMDSLKNNYLKKNDKNDSLKKDRKMIHPNYEKKIKTLKYFSHGIYTTASPLPRQCVGTVSGCKDDGNSPR